MWYWRHATPAAALSLLPPLTGAKGQGGQRIHGRSLHLMQLPWLDIKILRVLEARGRMQGSARCGGMP